MMINNYLPIALTNETNNQLRHPEALRNISFTYGYSGLIHLHQLIINIIKSFLNY